jgi:hypothetical protein
MIAHGCSVELIVELIQAKLATLHTQYILRAKGYARFIWHATSCPL